MIKANKRNKILILMSAALMFSYLPWYNFSAVITYIAKEFELTGSDTGLILSAFQAGYVVVVIFSGKLADRFGARRMVVIASLITAASATAFVFTVKGLYSILIMRLATGLAAGAIYAPGMDLLSNWFSPGKRGYAIGTYTGALTAAYAGGYFIASPLAASYGWRTGMLWTSLPAFISVAIILFFIKEKPDNTDANEKRSITNTIDIRPAPEGGYKGPALLTASYMGHMWELYAFWGWVGPFIMASAYVLGYSEVEATVIGGRFASLIILLGAPAVWIMGIIADRIGRTKAIIIGSLCSLTGQFIIGYLFGKSLAVIIILCLWIGFWVISDSGIYKAGLTEMVDARIRSTSLGLQSALGFSMTIVSPWLFGRILDGINDSQNPVFASNWGLPFMMLGAGALIAPVFAFFLRKTPQSSLMAGGKK